MSNNKKPDEKVNDIGKELKNDIKDATDITIGEDKSRKLYTIETPYSFTSIIDDVINEVISYNKYNKSEYSVEHHQAIETYSSTSDKGKKNKYLPNSYYYDVIKKQIDKLKSKSSK